VSGQNLITFTRASDGTYVDSDGLIKTAGTDVPRFDHDPVTGECLGLLVEEQRTNLLLRSEEFDDTSAWINTAGIVARNANAAIAPNGQLEADELVFPAANTGLNQTVTITNEISYAVSIWIKGTAGETIRFTANNIPGGGNVTLNGEWQRFAFSGVSNSTAGTLNLSTFGGVTARTIYVWGAQIEAGAFATSYIPTTTSAVTRSADVASITGANFSSWYRQDEGSSLVEFREPGRSSIRTLRSFSDGTSSNRWDAFVSGTSEVNNRIVIGGAQNNPGSLASSVGNLLTKHVIAVGLPNAIAACNGTLATPNTSSAVPSVNRLIVGADSIGGTPLTGTIRRLTYWPQRLPDTTLQAITQ
jgi:hypothetical protein